MTVWAADKVLPTKLAPNGLGRCSTSLGVQGEFFLQDLRWDQGTCSPDPPIFEPKQSFLEGNQDIVTHYFDRVSEPQALNFREREGYFVLV